MFNAAKAQIFLTMLHKQKSYLPIFTGFYNGIFSTDAMLENAIYMYNDYYGTDFTYMEYDFDEFAKGFGKLATEKVQDALTSILKSNKEHTFSLEFESVDSPSTYNYATDKIIITANFDDNFLEAVKNYLIANKETFSEYLINRYSDGLRGFTYWMFKESTDADLWIREATNVQDWDANVIDLQTFLDFILKNESYNADSLYWDISDTGFDLYDYLDPESEYNEYESDEEELE